MFPARQPDDPSPAFDAPDAPGDGVSFFFGLVNELIAGTILWICAGVVAYAIFHAS